ncbi:hypothetical protein NDU88_005809 [Pleurodeles waltl]|uniref:Uncharacterized protein n=1 Tax=Pleurodeles waltl TaxID=8319 RepID=A0AAV7NNK3_PLEWA|nr:hypothetical protein NDU88_005809 [Pleurodeles waltl]
MSSSFQPALCLWGRGLATGQDGRHPVRLCRGRAIYLSKSILNAVEKEPTPGASPRGLCRRYLSRVWLLSGPGERRSVRRPGAGCSPRAPASVLSAGGVEAAAAPPDRGARGQECKGLRGSLIGGRFGPRLPLPPSFFLRRLVPGACPGWEPRPRGPLPPLGRSLRRGIPVPGPTAEERGARLTDSAYRALAECAGTG